MFKDFLEWYNIQDVIPFVEAIEILKVIYGQDIYVIRCGFYLTFSLAFQLFEKLRHNTCEFKDVIYEPNQGIFKHIDSAEEDKYYPYEMFHDFEAIVTPVKEINNYKELKISMEHVPISVSILSNVPEYV